MAEFQIVAKEIERLCKAYQDKCRTDKCPLYLEDLCYAQAMSHIHEYEAGKLEDTVMRWSEEHPAPEYPTWYRWLVMMGAVASSDDLWVDLQQPIPADIAEELGIKPKKEG